MSRELTDDSAIRNAYSDQLPELGQVFFAMYEAGDLGETPEDFVANLRKYDSELQGLGDVEQVAAAVTADVSGDGPYATDHLEFVSRVMPLIPDQDGYSFDVKQRWYLDGEPVGDGAQSAGTDPATDMAVDMAASGRTLDEEKGLYFDDANWYDENGTPLEWHDDRKLYVAGDRWYDQNLVPLTWSEANNLYFDSSETWYDTNGFPLEWHADRGLYRGAAGWYDENLLPLVWLDADNAYYDSAGKWYDRDGNPLAETAAGEPEAAPGEPEAAPGEPEAAPGEQEPAPGEQEPAPGEQEPAPGEQEPAPVEQAPAAAEAVVADVVAEANQAAADQPDLTPEEIEAVLQQIIQERTGASATAGA